MLNTWLLFSYCLRRFFGLLQNIQFQQSLISISKDNKIQNTIITAICFLLDFAAGDNIRKTREKKKDRKKNKAEIGIKMRQTTASPALQLGLAHDPVPCCIPPRGQPITGINAQLDQKLDPTAEHGITKFSDLTASEFRLQFSSLPSASLPT
ncbi:unnamed protein product [Vicia faba]|uniref:Uncharacterized protein n=1 Tax=Vicia faba TaxID=3906 RepID=A0AAV0ZPM8_VICFA|nr:unnamed protein product [Vicia faba]